jgi:hypothetical protein
VAEGGAQPPPVAWEWPRATSGHLWGWPLPPQRLGVAQLPLAFLFSFFVSFFFNFLFLNKYIYLFFNNFFY